MEREICNQIRLVTFGKSVWSCFQDVGMWELTYFFFNWIFGWPLETRMLMNEWTENCLPKWHVVVYQWQLLGIHSLLIHRRFQERILVSFIYCQWRYGRFIRRRYALSVRHVFPREWSWTPVWLSWFSSSRHRHQHSPSLYWVLYVVCCYLICRYTL